MRVMILAVAAAILAGCASTQPELGMSQKEAWYSQRTREGEKYFDKHPVVTLRPDQTAPEECQYMEVVAAGPGLGVPNEQRNVRKVAALMGATHVQWQDVETAHLYRCPEAES